MKKMRDLFTAGATLCVGKVGLVWGDIGDLYILEITSATKALGIDPIRL